PLAYGHWRGSRRHSAPACRAHRVCAARRRAAVIKAISTRSQQMRSACMSVYKFRQFLFLVTLGIVMACASMASMAQASVPVLSVPDFTEVVAKTEGSVVNIRTTETVPVRPSPFGPGGGNDPYEMFRWFFGPDFAPPGMQPSPRRNAPAPSQEEQERTVPRGVGSGFIISE